jgi:hypothetical protein
MGLRIAFPIFFAKRRYEKLREKNKKGTHEGAL